MNLPMRAAALFVRCLLITASIAGCNKSSDPPAPPTPADEPAEETHHDEGAAPGKAWDGPISLNLTDASAHELLRTLREVTGKPIHYKKRARQSTDCALVTLTGDNLTREEFEERVAKALDGAGLKLEKSPKHWTVEVKPGASPCKK